MEREDEEPLALLAHDLRSTLAVVTGALKSVLSAGSRHGPLTAAQREILEMASRSTGIVRGLVDRLGSERIGVEGGALRVGVGAGALTTVGEVITSALAAAAGPGAASAAGASDLAATTDGFAPLGVQIEAGPDVWRLETARSTQALYRVVLNLVDNALRHGARPVRVRVGRDGDDLEVAVSDAGSGLPAVFRDLLEGPRPAAPARRPDGHRPLGLLSTRRLLDAQGGSLRMEEGPGTTIVARVPLADPG